MAPDELLPLPTIQRRHSYNNLLIPCLFMALATSLALNAIFGGVIVLHARRNKGELTSTSGGWSKEAAEEAERVAAIACSGHGAAFVEGAPADGNGIKCECYGCFTGPDCSRLKTDGCVADANSGSCPFVLMLSNESSKASTVKVVASFPYYQMYQQQTDYFKSDEFEFHGDAWLWKNNSDTSDKFIEFVTSPNNRDCQLNKAVLQGPSVKTIHDYAYYWPHFTAIPSPADDDVMLFTLSKLTGHAGSRFGWALIKDEAMYEKMKEYVRYNILVLSHETQLRALKLLKVVLEKGNGREIFEFAHGKMTERWQILNQVLSKTRRFSLQHIPPQFCSFFQRVREASPAYAWLRCNREEDTDCSAILKSAGIIGRPGSVFGGEEGNQYVCLSLLKSRDDFEQLIARIEKLVSNSADEDGPKTM